MVARPIRAASVRLVAARKRNGVRFLAVLDPWTHARYTASVAAATPAIEARLRPSVVANRVRRARAHPPILDLEPAGPARGRFARQAAELCRAPFVVIADVENCYPSIDPDAIVRGLGLAGVEAATTRSVLEVLAELSSAGVRGLPVGPAASAVLANAVLAEVDERLAEAGAIAVRWVDDLWVAAPSRREAEDVLGLIGEALAELRLRLSTRKTRIAAGTEAAPAGASPVACEPVTTQYHRPAHAHPLSGVPGSDAVASRRG